MVYNITTGVRLTAEDMKRIFEEIPSAVGMKYTDADYFEMRSILDLVDGQAIILAGRDELFLPALTIGAGGSIGTTQNIFPELFVGVHRAFLVGDWEKAQELQLKASRAVRVLLGYGSLEGRAQVQGLPPRTKGTFIGIWRHWGFFKGSPKSI